MEQGTLNELVLTRSVAKHIKRHNKNMLQGAGVGNDYSAIKPEDATLISADGVGRTPDMAWIKAMNNFYTSGGTPLGVRVAAMLPEQIEEQDIKRYMSKLNLLADTNRIQLLGGQTEVSQAYIAPSFYVTVLGTVQDYLPDTKSIQPGFQIIMTKSTGLCGTDIIARACEKQLRERFAASYIEGARSDFEEFSIKNEAEVAAGMRDKVFYMHDVSHGGVYGALWQLGSKINRGLKINHFDIPIKQETIEFCEVFNLNPYMLLGTGSLLIAAKDGEDVVQSLRAAGVPASIIGVVTEEKERVVVLCGSGDEEKPNIEKRFLSPVKGDELYKVVAEA